MRLYGCRQIILRKLHLRPAVVAEKRSLEHTRLDVLLRPARESGTVMSMHEGSSVSHSVVEDSEAAALTCTSMKAEPKLPDKTEVHVTTDCY